jgi:hypothetical protein
VYATLEPIVENGDYQVVLAVKDVTGNVGVGSSFKIVPTDIRMYPPVDLNLSASGLIPGYTDYSGMVSSGTYMDGRYTVWTNSEFSSTYTVRNLFNNISNTWIPTIPFPIPLILGIELPSSIVLLNYNIYPAEGSVKTFKRFFMEGSNDGETWDELDYQDNYTSWVAPDFNTFMIANPTEKKAYKSFRWRVLSSTSTGVIHIRSVKLFGYEQTEVRVQVLNSGSKFRFFYNAKRDACTPPRTISKNST